MSAETNTFRLFYEREFREVSEAALAALRGTIRSQEPDYVLKVNEAEYVEHLVSQFEIDPIVIDFANVSITSSEKQVPGNMFPGQSSDVEDDELYTKHVVTYRVPFSGDANLLRKRPSSYIGWTTNIYVEDGEICFDIIDFNNNPDDVKRAGKEFLDRLKQQAENLIADIKSHNLQIAAEAKKVFDARKKELQEREKSLEAIGVPIKKAKNVPAAFEVPPIRTKVAPALEKADTQPEYTIPEDVYQEILRILHDFGRVFERLPRIYYGKDEETLRDFLILILEPHFEFSATGETFNKEGKTDILVRHEKKNVFVAECKFWGGRKKHLETIDQILSYLTWRDSKTAIIYFVKNKEIAPVLKSIKKTTPTHSCFVSSKSINEESWLPFEFHLPGDKDRKLQLAILCFHVPEAEADWKEQN